MVGMTQDERYCNRCGGRLARDNTGVRCAACSRAGADGLLKPPVVPAGFWDADLMRDALATWHIGRVIHAYRTHPFHGRPLSQELVGSWLGLSQAQLSRIEKGRAPEELTKLTCYAKILGIPAGLLWFALPGSSPPGSLPSARSGLLMLPVMINGHSALLPVDAEAATAQGLGHLIDELTGNGRELAPGAQDRLLVEAFPIVSRPMAETIRREMEDTLAAGTVSPARLAHIEEVIASHVRVYTTTVPGAALAGLLLDLADLRRLMAERQPTPVQARLSEMVAVLATLAADSLMKLGRTGEASAWYGTAGIAADDSGNTELRARVRAQQAMLPYYYGSPAEVVRLARDAQDILSGAPRAAGALAAAAQARALARLGDRVGAQAAMGRAQDAAERAGEPDDDEAFRFGERRHLFYLSGTWTNLADAASADQVQAKALALYGDAAGLIDPALIRLDQAHLLVLDHDLDGACELIRQACLSLGPGYRTRVLSARVRQIIAAAPRDGRPGRVLGSLHGELFPPAGTDEPGQW